MLRNWLLFIHVLSAALYVGGAAAVWAQATGAAPVPGAFLKLANLAGRPIGIGAGVLLLSGVALVIESELWTFSMTFVLIGIGGWLAVAVVEGFYSRRKIAAIKAAVEEGGVGEGRVADGLRSLTIVDGVVLAVLVFVIWAMVFKPGV